MLDHGLLNLPFTNLQTQHELYHRLKSQHNCRQQVQHGSMSHSPWPSNGAATHLAVQTGRQEIASKIQQEVPADKILDEIHQSMPNNLHRHHILDKKDINNIQQAYCLKEIQHHPNDHQCPGMNWGMEKLAWHKSHHFSQDARRGKCRPGSLHWLNPRDNGLQL